MLTMHTTKEHFSIYTVVSPCKTLNYYFCAWLLSCLINNFSSSPQYLATFPAFLHQNQIDKVKTKPSEQANQPLGNRVSELVNWTWGCSRCPMSFCSVEVSVEVPHLKPLKANAGEEHIHNSATSKWYTVPLPHTRAPCLWNESSGKRLLWNTFRALKKQLSAIYGSSIFPCNPLTLHARCHLTPRFHFPRINRTDFTHLTFNRL